MKVENEGGQRQERRQHCGKKEHATGCVEEHLKDPIVAGEFVPSWIFGPRLVVEVVFNVLWPRGLRHGSRDVEKAFVGKGLV